MLNRALERPPIAKNRALERPPGLSLFSYSKIFIYRGGWVLTKASSAGGVEYLFLRRLTCFVDSTIAYRGIT